MIQASIVSRQAADIFFPYYRVLCKSSNGVVTESGLGEQLAGCSISEIRTAHISMVHLNEVGAVELVFQAYQKRLDKIYILCGRSEEVTSLVTSSGPVTFTVFPDAASVDNGIRENERGLRRLWARSVEVSPILKRDIPRAKLPAVGWFALDCGDLELESGKFYRVRIEAVRNASREGIPEDNVWIYGAFGCAKAPRTVDNRADSVRKASLIDRSQSERLPLEFSEDFRKTYIPLSEERFVRSGNSATADFVPLYELGIQTSLLEVSRTIHARDELLASQGLLDSSETLLHLGTFDNLTGLSQVRLKTARIPRRSATPAGVAEVRIREGKQGRIVHQFSFALEDCYAAGWLHFAFSPIRPDASGAMSIEVRLKLDAGSLMFDGFLRGDEQELLIPGRSVLVWNNTSRPPLYSSGVELVVPFTARCGEGLFSRAFGWQDEGFTPHRVRLFGNQSISFTMCVPHEDLRLVELPLFHPEEARCRVRFELLQNTEGSGKAEWIELLTLDCMSNSGTGRGVVILLDSFSSAESDSTVFERIKGEWLRIHLAAPSQSYSSPVEVIVHEVPIGWGQEKNCILHHPFDERITNIVNFEYREIAPVNCWYPWGAVRKRGRPGSSLSNYRLAVLSSGKEDAIFAKFCGQIQEAGGKVRRFREFGEGFWEYAGHVTFILLGEVDHLHGMADHIRMLRHFGIPVIEMGGTSLREKKVLAPQFGDLVIVSPSDSRESEGPIAGVLVWDSTRPSNLGIDLAEQVSLIHARRWPSFSVIAEYHGNSDELHTFLSAWNRQRYSGEVEVLLIYTHSDTNVYGAIEQWVTDNPSHRLDIQVVTNLSQRKVSVARNKAVNTAVHEVLIMTDLNQLPDRVFLEKHARLYTVTGCDAVFGDCDAVVERLGVPVVVGEGSYLRCGFGTSSFKRSLFGHDTLIFDEDDEDSGNGPVRWDEVELGIKLAQKRCYIENVDGALSRVVNRGPAVRESSVLSSGLKELYRLIKKYPEFEIECRNWITSLFSSFQEVLSDDQVPQSRESEKLTRKYTNVVFLQNKSDLGCQRVLFGAPVSPYLSTLSLSSHHRTVLGGEGLRPRAGKEYDLAIVEIDEFMLSPFSAPERRSWTQSERVFRVLDEFGDRAVCVCLGMPECRVLTTKDQEFQHEEYLRIRDYLKFSTIIFPSYEAQLRWDFEGANGYSGKTSVIWPGFDPAGYSKSLHQRLVVSHGPYIFSRPEYYGAYMFRDVAQLITAEVPIYRLNADVGCSEWDGAGFSQQRELVFRARRDLERYSTFLNTSPVTACTWRVIEGLLSGLIPVSIRSKDLALIVEHGRTGFLGDTAQELSEYVLTLNNDMALCRRISDLSRARACELFHHERFLEDWNQLLSRVVG